MNYQCGTKIRLGDLVSIPMPPGVKTKIMKVVMLGDTLEHLNVEKSFREWVEKDNLLKGEDVVLDFVGENPFKHNNPNFAPVGDYMFSPVDTSLKFIKRS